MQTGPVDAGVLAARLRAQTEICDPLIGTAAPLEVEAASLLWPDAARWLGIELLQVTERGARRLEEYRFVPAPEVNDLPPALRVSLPVAMLFERSPNGGSRARLYSSRPLVHDRVAILPVDAHLQPATLDPLLQRYFTALQGGKVDALLELFEPDGSLQRYDGITAVGTETLRATFTQVFSQRVPALRFCTGFVDGARTVYEMRDAEDQPALGVYLRSPRDKLAAVRLYS